MLIPLADWHTTIEAIVEGQDATVVRQRAEATHVADFLGIPATGRRVSWEVVTMVKVKGGRIIEGYRYVRCHGPQSKGVFCPKCRIVRHD